MKDDDRCCGGEDYLVLAVAESTRVQYLVLVLTAGDGGCHCHHRIRAMHGMGHNQQQHNMPWLVEVDPLPRGSD